MFVDFFEIFKNHLDCFDYDKEDFKLLERINFDRLGLINDKVCKVTPLLSQLTSYAIIPAFIYPYEYEELKEYSNEIIFDEAEEVFQASFEYAIMMFDYGCKHPSILNFKNLINISDCYEVIMDKLSLLMKNEKVDKEITGLINDFMVTVDDKVINKSDDLLDNEREKLASIGSSYDLLSSFSDCAFQIAFNKTMLSDEFRYYYINNNWIRYAKNDYDSVMLFDIVSKLSNYKKNCGNDGILSDISILEEAYYLLKSYQCDYLRNNYKEYKMLEKCKKM